MVEQSFITPELKSSPVSHGFVLDHPVRLNLDVIRMHQDGNVMDSTTHPSICGSSLTSKKTDGMDVSIVSSCESVVTSLPTFVSLMQSERLSESIQERKRKKDDMDHVLPLHGLEGRVVAGRWTREEHLLFLKGYEAHGREWNRVAKFIPTRNAAQVRSHAQKFLAKVNGIEHMNPNSALDIQGTKLANGHSFRSDCTPVCFEERKVSGRQTGTKTGTLNRILCSPDTVEQEVKDVMIQLHEKYRLLQAKLQAKKQGETQLCPVEIATDTHSSHSRSEECNHEEELIAVQVLRDGLRLYQESKAHKKNCEKQNHFRQK